MRPTCYLPLARPEQRHSILCGSSSLVHFLWQNAGYLRVNKVSKRTVRRCSRLFLGPAVIRSSERFEEGLTPSLELASH